MKDTVLITGANRGIGLELVRCFLADGAHVFAACRKPGDATALRALAAEDVLQLVSVDVTDAESVAHMVLLLGEQCIDVLVNNAGVMRREPSVEGVDYEDWLRTFSVNSMAPLRMATALKRNLLKSRHPRVITVSSQMGSIARNGGEHVAYRSSKAAVNMVMTTLAGEWRDSGITVCNVHPGWVRTEMGGAEADLSVETSARDLADLISALTPGQSGQFLNHDGAVIPW